MSEKTLKWLQAGLALLLAAGMSLSVACKDKSVTDLGDAAIQEAARQLPEGTNVLAALNTKDYEAALSALGKILASITPEQQDHYLALKQHVKNTLFDASEKDPKAAEALSALRMMTTGR